jgi:L-alanine-DL-glutamate epimerase-like enolase superfamily enzyme
MAISSVTAHAARIPVDRATSISNRVLAQREYVVVEIRCDDSHETGLGYAYTGTSGARVTAEIVSTILASVLVGEDEDAIVTHWQRMYEESLLAGRRGATLRAISAVDIALWDLAAKRRGLPLAVLLGGSLGPVPAYASGGYYRPDDGPWPEAVAEEIRFNQTLGFSDHKIKVGGLSVREDAERVTAACDVIQDSGRLAVDANNAYRTADEAIRAIRSFEKAAGESGLWWIEEPLSADDVNGHALIAARVDSPIATGELHQTRWEFRELIESGAAAILQPDVGVVGGVTEWMRVARTAETFSLALAPHWHANIHAQLARAAPAVIAIEHFALEKGIYNFELLLTEGTRLAFADGAVDPSRSPGIGIEFDPEALRRYAIEAH